MKPDDRGRLVITRYFGQGFQIGDEIDVLISTKRPGHNAVRIIIRAPKSYRIIRNEHVGDEKHGTHVRVGATEV